MLRGAKQVHPRSGTRSVAGHGGLGAVVPVPIVAPKRRRNTGAALLRWTAAGLVLGASVWGIGEAVSQMHADQAAAEECTALSLDRETGETVAGPCVGAAPPLPRTLTALLPGALPDHVAAAR